jgi:prepilin-type N-terminal cleavage/methylation domain-containing protein
VKRKAFTLIELLVVIAIIAILAAILFPVFAQAKDAAKDAAALSNAKQHGLAQIGYAADYDDVWPLNLRVEGNTFDTWQGMVQPYMKNWGILAHPKIRPFPVNTNSAQWYYQSRAHWGMPLRADAHANGRTPGSFYYLSASMTGGAQRRFDGIGGYGGADNAWGYRLNSSSLSTTAVTRPAETILVSEGGMWDYGWGFVNAENPMNYFWLNGTWVDPTLNVFNGTNYIGPHGRKRKIRCTGGDDPKSSVAPGFPDCQGALPWVDGMTTLVATDGHARGVNWRGGISGQVNVGTVQWLKWLAPTI